MDPSQKRSRGRPRAFSATPESTTIQALDRALHILKTLAASDGMSLTELAEASGQSPATVYRVLSTYEAHGMVEFQPATQLWFVGQQAFRIGSAFLGRSNLVEQARSAMHALMSLTGETANLAIADGGDVMFLSQVETHEPIRAFFRPGSHGPIHASGIGKALLAYYPQDVIERLMRGHALTAFTGRTFTDNDRLLEELAVIRGRGWALDDEEYTDGMRCIAAPIFNEFREPVAGISISGPTLRVTHARAKEIGTQVRDAADRITEAIGGTAPERRANTPRRRTR
ncbi:MAG TPA: IclR family transcriptional regulator [Amaricoccus sp.]|uniref:HTH-type transcriptional regulator BhcR n=1 Tax=Amaricoccus sp. TaxID=1872485 RepID=UPI001D625DF6|nr:HTH-type transcriptional regulator BhcR [Amaricoccus sp.]MCB1374845.1 IclR family transcriptional regulator [Paracoccaceae bacterium]MCC0066880.1 IclR family transcriptional regulator [Rhodovulum sp.]HPG22781.1 IclR family transcriptional regulator [Amaricoccus sp.]HRW14562.1 IclR family transcriptional regulator [Amaricoccus sp.]